MTRLWLLDEAMKWIDRVTEIAHPLRPFVVTDDVVIHYHFDKCGDRETLIMECWNRPGDAGYAGHAGHASRNPEDIPNFWDIPGGRKVSLFFDGPETGESVSVMGHAVTVDGVRDFDNLTPERGMDLWAWLNGEDMRDRHD